MSKASTPRRDPERTQADLLAVATDEFARDGFFGARADQLAAPRRTSVGLEAPRGRRSARDTACQAGGAREMGPRQDKVTAGRGGIAGRQAS